MCHALWRFERPTKASLFWTILCVIRPEPLGRGFGSGNASMSRPHLVDQHFAIAHFPLPLNTGQSIPRHHQPLATEPGGRE
jgi:hypothetical protein